MSSPALICCAFPFGYGPAVKLLLISRKLRAAGVQTIFLGHGIAHEMARDSAAFDEVIHALPTDPRAAQRIAEADGLFSMMDRDFARLALEGAKPVYVADSLHWMRDHIPAPFAKARRYWVQNFLSTKASAGTAPVGPIVEPRSPTPAHRRHGLVINLGGCETPAGPEAENFAYADFVLRVLLQSGVADAFPGDVSLLAGNNAIAHLRVAFPDCGINLQTATHDDALDLLGTAASVFTSPGLTTTLECFQFAVPTYFLPPQNYSQWRIVHHLQDIGLATEAFDWSQATAVSPDFNAVAEAARTPLLRRAISEVSALPAARQMFADSLQRWAAANQSALAARQHQFFASLGSNGVDAIAGELTQTFGADRAAIDSAEGVVAGNARSQ